ncbi:MAG: orotidine-5'-phosphate decarboxylase [Candidatus Omnitrophota bacterium]
MKEKLIVALDFDSLKEAKNIVDTLYPTVKIFKIGYQLFIKEGWQAVKAVKEKGADVFLDLKLFDIPNTVSKAVSIMSREDIFMFNVHALGGYKMMLETVKAAGAGNKKPLIIAVTLLTSFDKDTLDEINLQGDMEDEVVRLALLSKKAGFDGVVASVNEAEKIKTSCGKDFVVVCPGIRPAGVDKNDQKRIATPVEAISNGADYIVVGRPITQAENPLLAAREIKEQIKNV